MFNDKCKHDITSLFLVFGGLFFYALGRCHGFKDCLYKVKDDLLTVMMESDEKEEES